MLENKKGGEMILGVITENGEVLDKQEALNRASIDGQLDGVEYSLLYTILNSDRKDKYPSASQLGGAERQRVLENILEYYIKIPSRMPLLRGSLMHKGLEVVKLPTAKGVVKEKRLRSSMPLYKDIVLSGQLDLLYPQEGRLIDYKTASKLSRYVQPYHLTQLSVYKWLATWAGYEIKEAGIVYISWNYTSYATQFKVRKTETISVIEHWMMSDEAAFQERVADDYKVLYEGFHKPYRIPAISQCNTHWCSNCPVKWACDRIPVEGVDDIDLDYFDHREYLSY